LHVTTTIGNQEHTDIVFVVDLHKLLLQNRKFVNPGFTFWKIIKPGSERLSHPHPTISNPESCITSFPHSSVGTPPQWVAIFYRCNVDSQTDKYYEGFTAGAGLYRSDDISAGGCWVYREASFPINPAANAGVM